MQPPSRAGHLVWAGNRSPSIWSRCSAPAAPAPTRNPPAARPCCLRWAMKPAASGNCSHTCGRKVLRKRAKLKHHAVDAGAQLRERLGFAAKRQRLHGQTATRFRCRSVPVRGPATAQSAGRARRQPRRWPPHPGSSGRCASSVPMQPRSRPCCVRVTKLAPGSCSQDAAVDGCVGAAVWPNACAMAVRAMGSSILPCSVDGMRRPR